MKILFFIWAFGALLLSLAGYTEIESVVTPFAVYGFFAVCFDVIRKIIEWE